MLLCMRAGLDDLPESSPNFHIHHKRTASLRAMATMAMERFFFIVSRR